MFICVGPFWRKATVMAAMDTLDVGVVYALLTNEFSVGIIHHYREAEVRSGAEMLQALHAKFMERLQAQRAEQDAEAAEVDAEVGALQAMCRDSPQAEIIETLPV